VAFSPDGRQLASCSEDKRVRLRVPASGEHRLPDRAHRLGLGVAFSGGGTRPVGHLPLGPRADPVRGGDQQVDQAIGDLASTAPSCSVS